MVHIHSGGCVCVTPAFPRAQFKIGGFNGIGDGIRWCLLLCSLDPCEDMPETHSETTPGFFLYSTQRWRQVSSSMV